VKVFGRKPPEHIDGERYPPWQGQAGRRTAVRIGDRETRLKKIPGGQRALETIAREKAAAERGAPDQEKPKDMDQYNHTDPQSRIMPGTDGIIQGHNAQAAVENRQAGVEESLPSSSEPGASTRQKGREGNPSLRVGITSS
jgi:hypothetical protein